MTTYTLPDKNGRFGHYGGQFVPELLMPALIELEKAYETAKNDPEFQQDVKLSFKTICWEEDPTYTMRNS